MPRRCAPPRQPRPRDCQWTGGQVAAPEGGCCVSVLVLLSQLRPCPQPRPACFRGSAVRACQAQGRAEAEPAEPWRGGATHGDDGALERLMKCLFVLPGSMASAQPPCVLQSHGLCELQSDAWPPLAAPRGDIWGPGGPRCTRCATPHALAFSLLLALPRCCCFTFGRGVACHRAALSSLG